MKFTINVSDDTIQNEEGVEKSIKEVTKFEDADPQRIASELEILERQGYEVTVSATAKPMK